MSSTTRHQQAVASAQRVAAAAGFGSSRPVVLQGTNNVVVWLAPHPVVAKVGIWPHSPEVLAREVEVCSQLVACGAPVGEPVAALVVDAATSLPVSLWRRLDEVPDVRCESSDLADMLDRVHDALRATTVVLPTFLGALDHARRTLSTTRAWRRWPGLTGRCCGAPSTSGWPWFATARWPTDRCTANPTSATS